MLYIYIYKYEEARIDGISERKTLLGPMEEEVEDIVIVGAGIAGLSTALGLHRQGIRSKVLESYEDLRVTGSALTTWFNAWKALDALGLSPALRPSHHRLHGIAVGSVVAGNHPSRQLLFGQSQEHEARCLQRKLLLECLARELPPGTIRFSSKVVSIQLSGLFKLVHLADGTVLKTRVLVGCEGVNSIVARWLGFKNPVTTARSAIRGLTHFPNAHGFGNTIHQFLGNGVRSGFIPCNDHTVYWFLTHTPTQPDEETNPTKLKQFVLDKLKDLPDNVKGIVEDTDLSSIVMSRLKYRPPWEILWANITKDNVCVAGDALHPMTPDIGQGGCSALEDGVVLARCLGEALRANNLKGDTEEERYRGIENGLRKYASERKWRSIDLITTAYMVGFIQESRGKWTNLIRDKLLSSFLSRMLLKKSHFDCGKLVEGSP
ncbi:PREDICTED: uncharacterized protein LOC104804090 [Tarenaya hassleriana]|uniref:uncharacterized protein LOC104804090 n=1 Tax=Tarenaya hassleriana TaxID=28532 RepID=UPI00053C61BA|nr:PREDICTED: uncharacterized protein LOC104804090 [Tarenaya hassleriana]